MSIARFKFNYPPCLVVRGNHRSSMRGNCSSHSQSDNLTTLKESWVYVWCLHWMSIEFKRDWYLRQCKLSFTFIFSEIRRSNAVGNSKTQFLRWFKGWKSLEHVAFVSPITILYGRKVDKNYKRMQTANLVWTSEPRWRLKEGNTTRKT